MVTTTREQKKIIHLREYDKECRCCGHGRETICNGCRKLLETGYAIYVEITNKATMEKKKPTGYSVAILVDPEKPQYNNGDFTDPITEGTIYFIRAVDLREFLKDEYRKNWAPPPKAKQITLSPRSRIELSHR